MRVACRHGHPLPDMVHMGYAGEWCCRASVKPAPHVASEPCGVVVEEMAVRMALLDVEEPSRSADGLVQAILDFELLVIVEEDGKLSVEMPRR